ncbi:hypothetical protein D3C86_2091990 [compost metagenome]
MEELAMKNFNGWPARYLRSSRVPVTFGDTMFRKSCSDFVKSMPSSGTPAR